MKKKVKMLSIIIIVLLIAIIGIYNFGTSQYCIKNIIMPIVSKKTDSKIDIDSVHLSLFSSSLEIGGLDYQSPTLTAKAEKIAVKTSIYDLIFSSKINIKNFLIKNGNINLTLTSDAKEPGIKEEKGKTVKTDSPQPKKKSYKLSLNNINVDNLNLIVKNNDTVTKINNLNIDIPNIEPEKTSNINLNGNISLTEGQKLIKGFIKSSTSLKLNEQLLPININSNSIVDLDGNKTPIALRLTTESSNKFSFDLKASNILITPIAKAFIPGKYNNTKGIINEFSIEAVGTDINDLKTGSNPIDTKVVVTGTDISSDGNFYIKSKNLIFDIDIASVIKGAPRPGEALINDLDLEYFINEGQKVNIDNFNFKITNVSTDGYKAILNSNFAFKKGNDIVRGSAAGKLFAKASNIIEPQEISSSIIVRANGQRMPLNLSYENNDKSEKASISLKNFNLKPFSALLEDKLNKFHAGVADLNIDISGQGLNSIRNGLKKGNDIPLVAILSAKNIEVSQDNKLSAIVPDISIDIDLNKIINKSIKVNSCKIDDAKIVFVQEAKIQRLPTDQTNIQHVNTESPKTVNVSKPEQPKAESILSRISLNDIAINNVDIKLKNGDNITNIDGLHIDIPNIEPEKECRATFNCRLAFENNKTSFDGNLQSDTLLKVNNKLFPVYIKSQSLVDLDGNKTPLNISLNTKEDNSFEFNFKTSDFLIKPLAQAFFPAPYNNTEGYIKNISITAEGSNINDLKSASEPVTSLITVEKVNINSKGNFALENNLFKAGVNLTSILIGKPLIDYITLENFNAEYLLKDQKTKVSSLNLKLTQNSNNEYKILLNSDFNYSKGDKRLTGSAAGTAEITAANMFKPDNINSNINLTLNNKQIPINIQYQNKPDSETANIEISNFVMAPITPVLNESMHNLKGGIDHISIKLSADSCDGLKTGLKKENNSSINTKISVNNIAIKDKAKYAFDIPEFDIELDLAKILNKKYYIDMFDMRNAEITLYKQSAKAQPKTANNDYDSINKSKSSPSQAQKTVTKKDKNIFDIDLKNFNIESMKVNVISDKQLTLSNININSKRIKTSKPAQVNVGLDYLMDNKLSGKLTTQNNITVSPQIIPTRLESKIKTVQSGKTTYSTINFISQPTSSELIPFKLTTNVNDFNLSPFLEAFIQPPYDKTQATIHELNISMAGDNLYDFKTVNGDITSNLSDVSVPVNVGDENIIEVMFFPIRVIASLASSTALKFITGNVANALTKIDNMFNRKKRVEFKNGDLKVKLKKGVIDIKNFDFFGTESCPVTEMKINGLVNLNNKKLDLKTNTVFAGIIVPLEIGGTIQKPKTDTAKLTAQLLQKNTKTLINTGLESTGTVINTIDKIKKNNFLDLLKQPGSTGSTQSTSDTQSQSASQPQSITDTVSNVLNIIGNTAGGQTSNQSQQKTNSKGSKKTIKVDDAIKNLLDF